MPPSQVHEAAPHVSNRRIGPRWPAAVVTFVALGAALAGAQADPRTLPLAQIAQFTPLGAPMVVPTSAEGGPMYGGSPFARDQKGFVLGCNGGTRIAPITIGDTAVTVDGPCVGLPNLDAIAPGDVNGYKLGGVLPWKDEVLVTGYTYYDVDDRMKASHWKGTDITTATGPVRVGKERPALIGGYMAAIPDEWQTLLGGKALTGLCCISIIKRTSFGPTATAFDPDDLKKPATTLVGYPDGRATLGGYSEANRFYGGATSVVAVAFVPGTRTVIFVGRRGTTYCYDDGENCKDPTNPYKGPHGYPYEASLWFYDANDLALVKARKKDMWSVKPYAIGVLPGTTADTQVEGAVVHDGVLYVASRVWPTGIEIRRWRIGPPA